MVTKQVLVNWLRKEFTTKYKGKISYKQYSELKISQLKARPQKYNMELLLAALPVAKFENKISAFCCTANRNNIVFALLEDDLKALLQESKEIGTITLTVSESRKTQGTKLTNSIITYLRYLLDICNQHNYNHGVNIDKLTKNIGTNPFKNPPLDIKKARKAGVPLPQSAEFWGHAQYVLKEIKTNKDSGTEFKVWPNGGKTYYFTFTTQEIQELIDCCKGYANKDFLMVGFCITENEWQVIFNHSEIINKLSGCVAQNAPNPVIYNNSVNNIDFLQCLSKCANMAHPNNQSFINGDGNIEFFDENENFWGDTIHELLDCGK